MNIEQLSESMSGTDLYINGENIYIDTVSDEYSPYRQDGETLQIEITFRHLDELHTVVYADSDPKMPPVYDGDIEPDVRDSVIKNAIQTVYDAVKLKHEKSAIKRTMQNFADTM